MAIETATDIYAAVSAMRQETIDALEADDVLYGDPAAYARREAEAQAFLRVLHVLEDDFGVMRPFPSLTRHLP